MYLKHEVNEILKWADKIADKFGTSELKILIEFDKSYKQVKDIQKAKFDVERLS